MTVEQWLRGHFGGVGKLIEKDTLLLAAISPAEVEPEPLRAVSLTDEYEDYLGDTEYKKGVLYALSTLYYAMSGYTDGGTRSEKRGNRQITIGGKPIDVKTREDWRKLGNSIRRKLNVDIDEEVTDSGGMRDYTYMQYRPTPNRRIR